MKTKHSGLEGNHLYWEELLNWIRRGFSFWTRILMMLMNNRKLTCWQAWMELEVRGEDRPPRLNTGCSTHSYGCNDGTLNDPPVGRILIDVPAARKEDIQKGTEQ